MSFNSPSFYLYKRPSKIYYIGYYLHGRLRWKSTGARTKPEAQKALTQFREMMEQGRQEIISLREFVERFMAYSEANHAGKTARLFRDTFRQFSKTARNAYLRELTPEHFDKYKARRMREVSPVSVNVELRMLKSAFNTAKRWRLIDQNPCDGVLLATVPERAPAFFTLHDFQRLLDTIQEGWLREVVLFAVLTGMRQGEILNLKWTNVNLSKRVIHVETTPSFKTKQGRRRTGLTPKSRTLS